jgi:hypothetical protein
MMQALCFSCKFGEPIKEDCIDGSVFVDRVVCKHFVSKRNPKIRIEKSIRVKCPHYLKEDPEGESQ